MPNSGGESIRGGRERVGGTESTKVKISQMTKVFPCILLSPCMENKMNQTRETEIASEFFFLHLFFLLCNILFLHSLFKSSFPPPVLSFSDWLITSSQRGSTASRESELKMPSHLEGGWNCSPFHKTNHSYCSCASHVISSLSNQVGRWGRPFIPTVSWHPFTL